MRNTLIAASALALMAGAANAATYTQNFSDITGPGTGTFNVEGWNTAFANGDVAGVFVGATYTYTLTTTTDGTITNNGNVTADFDVYAVNTGLGPAPFFNTVQSSLSGSVIAELIAQAADGPSSHTLAPGDSDSYSLGTSTTDGGSLSFVDIASDFSVDYETFARAILLGAGEDGTLTFSSTTDLSLAVSYEYVIPSEVPVPAALPLLAAAFGVMGLVRARRA